VFVALGIHHKMRVLHIVICGLPGSTIFLHCIIKGMIFVKKKVMGCKMCLFILCTTFACNISHSNNNLARYDQKCMLVFM